MTFASVKLKRVLVRSDAGAWGEEPIPGHGTPVLRATEIGLDGVINPRNVAVRSLSPRELAATRLQNDDLVIVKSSGSDAHLGKAGRVTCDVAANGVGFSNFLQRLRVDSSCDSRFVWYFLNSSLVKRQIRLLSSTSTGLQNLSASLIGELDLPRPSFDKQRRIADYLDAETRRIDEVRRARSRMQDLLRLKRERVIEHLIDDQGNTRTFVPLKHLVESVTVGIVVTPAAWYVDTGGVPALRGVNVKPGRIDDNDLVHISHEGHLVHRKSRLRVGDLVVVRTGQAGAAAVVTEEFDGVNCIDLVIVRPGVALAPRFVEYLLNSSYAKRRVAEFAVGSIQSHFNVAAMKAMPVPGRSLADQHRIVLEIDRAIEPIERMVSAIVKQDELLAERRQALITAAVTGQMDVSTARRVEV